MENRDTEVRIYRELEAGIVTVFYIEELIDTQTRRQKLYSGILALLSSGGGLSAIIQIMNGNIISKVLSILLPFLAAISIIFNQFSSIWIRSANEMSKLSKLYGDYIRYSDSLHNIFALYTSDEINEKKALLMLKEVNSNFADNKIEGSIIFGNISNNSKEYKRSVEKQIEYLNSIYNYDGK